VTDLHELFAPDVVAAIEALVQAEVASALAAREREPQSRWLNTKDAAAYVGCTERALHQRVRRGRIPSGAIRHAGRRLLFDRLALDRVLESGL
jgi:hypothetical protein